MRIDAFGYITAAWAAAWLLAAPAAAQQMVAIEIANLTPRPLTCQALAAHWYTLPELAVPAGGRGVLRVARGAPGAALFATAAGLPLERMYCGPAGNAWARRGELDLLDLAHELDPTQGAAGRGERTLLVVCREAGAALRCGQPGRE